MSNILFLHAHPDDEAIFTGGTIAALADHGHEITVVFGTGGELGIGVAEQDLAQTRREEAISACQILGVTNVEFLDYHDSGIDVNEIPPNALARCDIETASAELASLMTKHKIEIVFCDDEYGIYGHPDHKMCHQIGLRAAELHGLDCITEFSVDGEYLHFVESHVVKDAFLAFGIDQNSDLYRKLSSRQHPGLTTVEISDEVTPNGVHLLAKRQAMAAHSSQIPDGSAPLEYDEETFAQVYGLEWFRHHPINPNHEKQPGVLDNIR